MTGKTDVIKFRIDKNRNEDWKTICKAENISLTSLITNSVENRLMDNERKKVLAFIEKQDNLFVKIETNINQIAKIANAQKFISAADLQDFSNKLSEIADLKIKQNDIFIKIYSLLGQ